MRAFTLAAHASKSHADPLEDKPDVVGLSTNSDSDDDDGADDAPKPPEGRRHRSATLGGDDADDSLDDDDEEAPADAEPKVTLKSFSASPPKIPPSLHHASTDHAPGTSKSKLKHGKSETKPLDDDLFALPSDPKHHKLLLLDDVKWEDSDEERKKPHKKKAEKGLPKPTKHHHDASNDASAEVSMSELASPKQKKKSGKGPLNESDDNVKLALLTRNFQFVRRDSADLRLWIVRGFGKAIVLASADMKIAAAEIRSLLAFYRTVPSFQEYV